MIVGDLFAGVGGLSEGFLMTGGFDIAFAVEFDKEIASAYQRNHAKTDVIAENICDIDAKSLHTKYPQIDVIIGGPPCQGFSQKGKRLNLDDPRNFLFLQYVRFVSEFKPKYFVLENVPNIITTSNGYFKDQIVSEFEKLGYKVTYGILSASDFGVPQERRRAVFIGQLGDTLTIALPKPDGKHTTIKEAIYDLPFIESGEGAEQSEYTTEPFSDYQKELRRNCKILYNHVATKHSQKAIEKLKMIPKGAGKEVLPSELLTKSIYSGTWCRMIEDGLSITITTRFDTPSSGRFTHPILNRCITVREAARIQSFPDSYIFYGNKGAQMKEVGNAVPPFLARAIANEILKNEKK